jgi:steroid delta-isomerase-like uncharacterized protein
MSTERLKREVRAVMEETFNERRPDALDRLFAVEMVDRSAARAEDQVGLEGFKRRVESHYAGVPDLRAEIFEMVGEGDLIAYRWTFSGTHGGTWFGYPATNRQVVLHGMNLERFENGKVVEHFSFPNLVALFRQLGAT